MTMFHQNLKYLRSKTPLSQSEMGKKFGVTQAAYGAWENGSEPNLEMIIGVADYFQVSLDDLVRRNLSDENESGTTINERMDRVEMVVEKLADGIGVDIREIKKNIKRRWINWKAVNKRYFFLI